MTTRICGNRSRRYSNSERSSSIIIMASGGRPESVNACEIAPVPAPSSTTTCPGRQTTWLAIARARARDDGMIDPIDLGERSHWRKKSSASLTCVTLTCVILHS